MAKLIDLRGGIGRGKMADFSKISWGYRGYYAIQKTLFCINLAKLRLNSVKLS